MIVKALCNVYHGVTNELTCKEGDIFTVVNIVNNPECADFRAIGKIPAPGHWVQFKETGGMIHRAVCFGVLNAMEELDYAIELKRIKEQHEGK
jgi:hypothetical protein